MPQVDFNESISASLDQFIEKSKVAFGGELVSILIYGSAAENRLRQTSDVNLMVVLNKYRIEQINLIRDEYRLAHAAIKLNIMFILKSEVALVSDAFAVKFTDIIQRNRILYGENPFVHLIISREAQVQKLRQVIFNLMIRMREKYALLSLRPEALRSVLAETASPLRSFAVTICQLEEISFETPKQALELICNKISAGKYAQTLETISLCREGQNIGAEVLLAAMIQILLLIEDFNCLAENLSAK